MVDRVLSEDQYFYTSNGVVIRSLSELKQTLKSLDAETFSHHVSSDKNDFYNWVKSCLKDSEAASRIKSANTADEMLSALDDTFASPGDFFSGTTLAFTKPTKEISDVEQKEDYSVKPKKKPSSVVSEIATLSNKQEKNLKIGRKNVNSSQKKSSAKKSRSVPKLKKTVSKIITSKKEISSQTVPSSADDLAFELDDQRDVLARIRERIKNMDAELKNTRTKYKESVHSLDEKYPELSHESLDNQEFKRKKKVVHHVSDVAKKVVHHVHHHVKNVQRHIRSKMDDARQQREVNKYLSSGKKHALQLDKKKNVSGKGSKTSNEIPVVDNNTVKYDMEAYYGQGLPDKQQPKQSFFHNLFFKSKGAEKVVEKELPNLHEFEHAKQAQEYFTVNNDIEHPGNYHNQGIVDFLRGLLIGILIGMLFLILF